MTVLIYNLILQFILMPEPRIIIFLVKFRFINKNVNFFIPVDSLLDITGPSELFLRILDFS